MPTRTPTLSEVLEKWRDGVLRDLRVALPARVVKYDPTTQLADVKPEIQDFFFDEDDSTTTISIPVVTNVPVQWPSGGGFALTCPLAVGDKVTMLVHDRSLDAWLAQGGEQAPADQRRHCIADAVALPGLHDNQTAWTGVATDGVALGKPGGMQAKVTASQVLLGQTATQPAVCGTQLQTALNVFLTALGVYAAAIQGIADPSSTATPALTSAITALEAAVYTSATVQVQP